MLQSMILQSHCAGCQRPGVALCRTCRFALASGLRSSSRGLPGASGTAREVIAAVPFTGRPRDVLLGFKYRNRRQLAGHLAGLLVNRLLAEGLQPGVDFDVVTWAPTSPSRRRHRGFDQAEMVARHVAAQLGVRCRRLLERTGDTAPQTGSSRWDRLRGPSFKVRPGVAGRAVLVIDDVVTTGSTLRSAADALRAAGAVSVVRAAVAATPSGVSARHQRWGHVVAGPWAGSDVAANRGAERRSRAGAARRRPPLEPRRSA